MLLMLVSAAAGSATTLAAALHCLYFMRTNGGMIHDPKLRAVIFVAYGVAAALGIAALSLV